MHLGVNPHLIWELFACVWIAASRMLMPGGNMASLTERYTQCCLGRSEGVIRDWGPSMPPSTQQPVSHTALKQEKLSMVKTHTQQQTEVQLYSSGYENSSLSQHTSTQTRTLLPHTHSICHLYCFLYLLPFYPHFGFHNLLLLHRYIFDVDLLCFVLHIWDFYKSVLVQPE